MEDFDFERGDLDFLDWVALISLFVGFENLELNQKQVDGLMNELTQKQDAALEVIIQQNKQIIKQNEEILRLLKERR